MTNAGSKPIAVVKVGGDMVLDEADRRGLAENIQDLIQDGWHCVVLHGGGPQLNRLQTVHGLTPNKVDGRRITGQNDLMVVKQALCGEVNVDLCSALIAGGVNAFGCHGASGKLIQARKRPPMDFGDKGFIDLGEVGDVASINVTALECLLAAGFVPVVASLGVSETGRIFNINADTTVAAIAKSLRAQLLILSTKVGAVFADINQPSSRITEIDSTQAEQLIDDGIITDGMIPKLREAFSLLDQGVGMIAIANAAASGGFLDLAAGKGLTGTRLVSA